MTEYFITTHLYICVSVSALILTQKHGEHRLLHKISYGRKEKVMNLFVTALVLLGRQVLLCCCFFFTSPCFGRQAPVPSVYLRAAKGFFKARDLKTEQHAGVSVEYTEQDWEILMPFIRRSKADVFWAQMSKIKHLSEWISNRFKLKLEVLIACKSGSFWKGHRWKMWTLSMWKRSNSEQV